MAIKVVGTTVIDDSRNALNLTSINSTGSITADSDGNSIILGTDGGIEIFRSGGGAYIDFKNSSLDDYDVRLSNPNGTTNLTLTGSFTATSTITGTSFVVGSGTSTQFLKANGTVDSTPYSSKGNSIAMALVFGF